MKQTRTLANEPGAVHRVTSGCDDSGVCPPGWGRQGSRATGGDGINRLALAGLDCSQTRAV